MALRKTTSKKSSRSRGFAIVALHNIHLPRYFKKDFPLQA
jgi:hypothetical protein